MLKIINHLYKKWTRLEAEGDIEFRWFYYDQSSFNQYRLQRNIAVGPKGVKFYAMSRTSIRVVSITLHMLVDQYGYPHYWEFAMPKKVKKATPRGPGKGVGQTQVDIERFLYKALKHLPHKIGGRRPIIFFDHLSAHVNISKKVFKSKRGRKMRATFRLTPLTFPDANVVESCFRSLKSQVRRQLAATRSTLKPHSFIVHLNSILRKWKANRAFDDKILDGTIAALRGIVAAKGNLQTMELAKRGMNDLDEIILKDPLHPSDSDGEATDDE